MEFELPLVPGEPAHQEMTCSVETSPPLEPNPSPKASSGEFLLGSEDSSGFELAPAQPASTAPANTPDRNAPGSAAQAAAAPPMLSSTSRVDTGGLRSGQSGTLAPRPPLRSRMVHDLKARLRAPVAVLVLALVVAVADMAWYRVTGEHAALGPVRLFWVAAPLALFAVGFTLWRFMEANDDG
jgi:hypothetical protein